MRVILTGTRSFAKAILDEVAPKHDVVAVASPADDPLVWAAQAHGIEWREHVRAEWVRELDADLILGVHTTDFIGRKSRAATRLGALVGHPSLLPRHRGRSSVDWTVRMNDPIAGFTYFWADDGVDTGPIAAQDWCHVDPKWTASDLWREALFPMGVEMIAPLLDSIESFGQARLWRPQDERFATVEPAIEPTRLYRPELIALPAGKS